MTILNNIYDTAFDIQIKFKGILERRCGQVTKIFFKNNSESSQAAEYNETLSGFYFIKSINHTFTKDEYTQNINFIRYGEMNKVSNNQIEFTKKIKSLK